MSLATWLRAGRDRRKLTIEDVAKITKIQPRILEKLESGQLEGLPAEVFVKGFVRSFAKCVGLDEVEALDKYSAAQAAPTRRDNSDSGSFAIAKALVETMQPREGDPRPKDGSRRSTRLDPLGSGRPIDVETVIEAKRVAQGTPVEPAPVIAEPVIEAAPVIEASVVEPALEAPVVAAPVDETPVVEAAVAIEPPQPTKKKRSRKNSKQRAKHKKQVQEELAAVAAAVVAVGDNDSIETNVFEKQSIDTGPVTSIFASGDGESLDATSIEAKTTEPLSTASEPEATDGVVESAPLAEGSNPTIAISEQGLESPAALEATSGETTQATWQPTMPPIATTSSMPWRRPNLPTTPRAPVVPSLLIDDADPDSADRERDDRIAKEPNRLSFLPPILLDREDRSARQGGLTLAVIILLIAATLTLSYLMRRPSPSGDGVTMLDGTSQLIGSQVLGSLDG